MTPGLPVSPRLLDPVLRAIDRSLPQHLREGGPEALRVGRLVAGLSIVCAGNAALFAVAHAVMGSSVVAMLSLGAALLMATTPAFLFARGAPEVAGAYLSWVTWVVVTGFSVAAGGIETTGMAWLCVPPLLALLVSTRAVAGAILALSVASVLVFGVLEILGWEGHVLPHDVGGASMGMVVYGLLPVVTTAIGWSYATTAQELRKVIDARSETLALVLNNVAQGLLLVDRDGTIVGDNARALEVWFGKVPTGQRAWPYLFAGDARAAAWMQLGWEMLAEGIMPEALCIAQLPSKVRAGGRLLSIEYRAMPGHVLIVVSDTTDAVAAQEREAELLQLAAAFEHAAGDPGGFASFLDEVDQHLVELARPSADWRRRLHTLKACFGMFGAARLSRLCHGIEEDSVGREVPDPDVIADLARRWAAFTGQLSRTRGGLAGAVVVPAEAYETLCRAVEGRAAYPVIAELLHGLSLEPASAPLARAAGYAQAIARELGKDVVVEADGEGIQLPPAGWAGVWATLPHVVRNAVDHGIEPSDVRVASGKSGAGHVRIALSSADGRLELCVADDGGGVDWARVAEKLPLGELPTYDQLEEALFMDGFSTREEATEWSGRGVGLGAFREAVRAVGGDVQVRSRLGQGTTVTASFRAPVRRAAMEAR